LARDSNITVPHNPAWLGEGERSRIVNLGKVGLVKMDQKETFHSTDPIILNSFIILHCLVHGGHIISDYRME
jgi:hypothetical protein